MRYLYYSALAVAFTATSVLAQTYPAKTVRIMVGFPAGSSTDIVSRIVAQKLSELWGQQAIVDNRPGAGANIAAEVASRAAPDGYTLLVAQNALAISRSLYARLGYDALKDLTAIGAISAAPHILLVHPTLPAKSVKELIALAKKRPGEMNFSSSGIGINDHMLGELFKNMASINVVHVPYKGGNLAAADVISGQITYYFAGMPVGLPLYKTNRLRALAVTSKERYRGAPELPTMGETVPGYEAVLWQALLAPAATPPAVIAKLSDDLGRARQSQDMRDRLWGSGVEVLPMDAAQFNAFFRSEVEKWARVIREEKLKAE